jgi:hypothetical protein
MKTAFFLVALLFPILPAKANDPSATTPMDPAKTVQAFYDFYLTHHGSPDVPTVKATRQYFTPRLYSALITQFSKPVAKGDAPDIDWDVFLDSQEVPRAVKAGKATIDKDTAKVGATTYWSSKDQNETIVVTLVRVDGKWKIKDFYYPVTRTNLTDILWHAS